jgi:hypothetical protein
MIIGKHKNSDAFAAGARAGAGLKAGGKVRGRWEFVCRDKHGRVKWTDVIENLVVNVGLDDLLDKYFKGSAYTAAHYVGLTDGTPTPAAGDTMASHAGWTEVTAYDEATRQAFTPGTVSGQSVDNSASKATFTISADTTTVGGAFLTTNNTKGGSTGTLYAIGAFSAGDKSLDDNDTLDVTATFTSADDGV